MLYRQFFVSSFSSSFDSTLYIFATVVGGPLAIAISPLDSLLHLMVGRVLWLTHLSKKDINIYKYPVGKLRIQPDYNGKSWLVQIDRGFQMLVQAFRQLIQDKPTEKDEFRSTDLDVCDHTYCYELNCFFEVTAEALKTILFEPFAKVYSHTNQLVLRMKVISLAKGLTYMANKLKSLLDVVTNVMGLIAAVFGDKFYWCVDPNRAIF